MLVFAHSSGRWIEHEVEQAVRFGVPIVAVLDPDRLAQPRTRSRTEKIAANATSEVRLDDTARIIAAVRRYSRAQGMPIIERVSISRLVSRETEPAWPSRGTSRGVSARNATCAASRRISLQARRAVLRPAPRRRVSLFCLRR